MNTEEHRAFSRITIHDGVTLMVKGVADSETCILENISKSGVKFYSTRKLDAGKVVELHVPSPEGDPEIIIKAKTLRVEPGEHGKPYSYACVIESTKNA